MGDGIAITRADSTGVPPPSAAQYRVGHGEPDGRPCRLSFLLHLDSDQPPAAAYRHRSTCSRRPPVPGGVPRSSLPGEASTKTPSVPISAKGTMAMTGRRRRG